MPRAPPVSPHLCLATPLSGASPAHPCARSLSPSRTPPLRRAVSDSRGVGGTSAAAQFSGYALYSLMQEEATVVIDAVGKVCKNEGSFGRALEACCPELLSVLQRRVVEKLQKAGEGADVKHLQEMLSYGHGVMLPAVGVQPGQIAFRHYVPFGAHSARIPVAHTRHA